MKDFFKNHYKKINFARLIHYKSLNLNFKNFTIIELGAGAGFFSKYLLKQNIKSLDITDGRDECVNYLKNKFSKQNVFKLDLNKLNNIHKSYDCCFAYGVLYHVENLDNAIENINRLTNNFCIIETIVTHDKNDKKKMQIVEENIDVASQSITGKAARFKRDYLIKKLNDKFKYVYTCNKQPFHSQFPKNWHKENKGISRFVVIGSRIELNSKKLNEKMLMSQKQLNIFEVIYNYLKL
jgi:2-polyprenyl-3-methyl-5-hydroxy-6-metoxy-1,4-benzoquinol methylase